MRKERLGVAAALALMLAASCRSSSESDGARLTPIHGDPGPRPSDVFTQVPASPTFPETEMATATASASAVPTEVPAAATATPTETRQPSFEARLDAAAKAYLAGNTERANEVARKIDWLQNGFEDVSDMCGPLSGQILIDAGIIRPLSRDELRTYFWLKKADRDKALLLRVFPEDKFEWRFIEHPFGTYDFASDPLEPGDWIYLFANEGGVERGGNFNHMLTVTRVERDQNGRVAAAYSVTNIYLGTASDGKRQYQIAEVKLFDTRTGEHLVFGYPNTSHGLWTGSTFLVVRQRAVSEPAATVETASNVNLNEPFDRTLGDSRGIVIRVDGDKAKVEFVRGDIQEKQGGASTVKVLVALAVVDKLIKEGVPSDQWQGVVVEPGLTVGQAMKRMLVVSDEEMTATLEKYVGQDNINRSLSGWGVADPDIAGRRFSLYDFVNILTKFYEGKLYPALVQDAVWKYLIGLMEEQTTSDSLRSGKIKLTYPNVVVANKRGSIPGNTGISSKDQDALMVGDVGYIFADGKVYIFAEWAHQDNSLRATYENLEAAQNAFFADLGLVLRGEK